MSKHPVIWFYVLAFGISWLGWIPAVMGSRGIASFVNPSFQFLLILSAVGPALAAIIVTLMAHGKAQVRDLLKPLVQWRVHWGWYLIAVFLPLVLLLLGQGLTQLMSLPATQTASQGESFLFAVAALVMSLLSNPLEEVGWRGFALPRLQKRYTALTATLIVGVLWGLWHVPFFFWSGNPIAEYPFLPWFAGTVAAAFIYTWLYNSTQGNLLVVSLFHVMLNTFGGVINGVSIMILSALQVLIALVVWIRFGGTNLSPQERMCAG